MSIADDLKGLSQSLRKSGHKSKKPKMKALDASKGWYAHELKEKSRAGIDQKHKIQPSKNVRKSPLFKRLEK